MPELLLIILLLCINGVFAMAEIALVSVKRTRLQQRADEGNASAITALSLTANPERFLSTVQIGITLVGVLAGAFGGDSLSAHIKPMLEQIPSLSPKAVDKTSFFLAVAFITYLSLVIGELVPKGIALRHAEKVALFMAKPMSLLATWTSPLVWLLEKSSKLLMFFVGKESVDSQSQREDVQVLLREGIITGGVKPDEEEMVSGVLDLQDTVTEEIMLPRPKVTFLPHDATHESAWELIYNSKQSVFPIYRESRDNICGMVGMRMLYASLANTKAPTKHLSEIMTPPSYVTENHSALGLFETLRKTPHGAALVTDEFGTIRGLITLDDVIEEIVGDLPDSQTGEKPPIRKLEESTWIADGMVEIDDLLDILPEMKSAVEAEEEPFQTLAGFVMHKLDRLPAEGEEFHVGNLHFHIADMDQQRIDKIIIRRLDVQEEESHGDSPN